ncbi:exodeoxyribonuclease VII small subunit [Candidatus Saccharibacteria bacterium CPR2]|nr:exodeoxyribonuclease VII small subunit [Candidatus Saccharibacteria bacterium CPR2]
MSQKNKVSNFSELMNELEEIVSWFEESDVDLDEGLKKFERGAQIVDVLKKRLKEASNKVTKIQAKYNSSSETE